MFVSFVIPYCSNLRGRQILDLTITFRRSTKTCICNLNNCRVTTVLALTNSGLCPPECWRNVISTLVICPQSFSLMGNTLQAEWQVCLTLWTRDLHSSVKVQRVIANGEVLSTPKFGIYHIFGVNKSYEKYIWGFQGKFCSYFICILLYFDLL